MKITTRLSVNVISNPFRNDHLSLGCYLIRKLMKNKICFCFLKASMNVECTKYLKSDDPCLVSVIIILFSWIFIVKNSTQIQSNQSRYVSLDSGPLSCTIWEVRFTISTCTFNFSSHQTLLYQSFIKTLFKQKIVYF